MMMLQKTLWCQVRYPLPSVLSRKRMRRADLTQAGNEGTKSRLEAQTETIFQEPEERD